MDSMEVVGMVAVAVIVIFLIAGPLILWVQILFKACPVCGQRCLVSAGHAMLLKCKMCPWGEEEDWEQL